MLGIESLPDLWPSGLNTHSLQSIMLTYHEERIQQEQQNALRKSLVKTTREELNDEFSRMTKKLLTDGANISEKEIHEWLYEIEYIMHNAKWSAYHQCRISIPKDEMKMTQEFLVKNDCIISHKEMHEEREDD